ncbi:MAG: hypothetical protein ACYDCL_06910 [Myxococcales bacterium]
MRRHLWILRPSGLLGLVLWAGLGCPGPSGHTGDGGGGDGGPSCLASSDCDGGLVCLASDGGAGQCGPCATNGQCAPQQQCDPGAHGCVFLPGWGDQCSLNGDCSLGQFCKQGLCVTGSQVTVCTNGNCPTGQRCNQANQVCEQDLGCLGNSYCPAGESCNLGTRACQPTCTAADAAQICQPAQRCVNSICVDCTSDADCGPGIQCNVAEGRCEGAGTCFTTGDCPAGEVCNLATNSCGATPPPCLSNDDCPANQLCDPSVAQCVPVACQHDVFYPNGTAATAAPIQAGVTYSNLELCNGADAGQQQSWFSLQLQSGDRIQATVNADATGCGYTFDVQLRDGNGTILADGNLVIDQTVAASASYDLRMTDGDPQCSYGFGTLVSHGTPCPPNPYAPNADATQAAPLALDGGGAALGPVWLCAGSQEWYVVALPAGESLTANLGCDPTQGPLTLTLYDGDGVTELAQDARGLENESATATPSAGRIYVVVTGDGLDSNAYTLSLTAGGG